MLFHQKNSFFDLGDHFVSTQHFPQIKSLYPPGLELQKSGQKNTFHTRKKRRTLPRTNSSPPKNRPFQEENQIKSSSKHQFAGATCWFQGGYMLKARGTL